MHGEAAGALRCCLDARLFSIALQFYQEEMPRLVVDVQAMASTSWCWKQAQRTGVNIGAATRCNRRWQH